MRKDRKGGQTGRLWLLGTLGLAGMLWLTGCSPKAVSVWREDSKTQELRETAETPVAWEETQDGALETADAAAQTQSGETEQESGAEAGTAAAEESGNDGTAGLQAEIPRQKVRGIYVTGAMAGTDNMDSLIELVDRTELNTLVIDVKNDEGRIVCDMEEPLVQEIGAVKRYVRDMPGLIAKCKEKGIYLIARIVAFKDPFLAEAKPEWSLHNADGSIFRDKSGQAWVNPYERQVWDYLISVSKEAVALGFDEVQLDYVRFSTDSGMKQVDFGPEAAAGTREDVIAEFTAYAAEELHKLGAAVSADVYGVVIDSKVDQQIVGQDYRALSGHLDAISPMVYPSHYGPYNYNIPVPDAQPYDTVLAAMQASRKVLAGLDPRTGLPEEGAGTSGNETDISGNEADVSGNGAGISGNATDSSGSQADVSGNQAAPEMGAEEIAALSPAEGVRAAVRPWLQDFTASWVKGHIQYGPQQIREQIQAVYDAGYEEWILWNAGNRYTEGGLYGPEGQPMEEADVSAEEIGIPTEEADIPTEEVSTPTETEQGGN